MGGREPIQYASIGHSAIVKPLFDDVSVNVPFQTGQCKKEMEQYGAIMVHKQFIHEVRPRLQSSMMTVILQEQNMYI